MLRTKIYVPKKNIEGITMNDLEQRISVLEELVFEQGCIDIETEANNLCIFRKKLIEGGIGEKLADKLTFCKFKNGNVMIA